MMVRKGKKLATGFVLGFAFLISASSLVVAQDTSKVVYDRCTECHTEKRWEDKIKKKLTEKQWAKIVDQMVRYGAQLTPEESDLVVEYLTARSTNKIKQPTTTTSKPVEYKATTTTAKKNNEASTAKITTTTVLATTTSTTPTTVPTTVATTVLGTSTSVLSEQAHTGVEMIWYLLGGGMMFGSGLALRNKDKQLG